MMIPLMLWNARAMRNRTGHVDRMRAVSSDDARTDWILLFLSAPEAQARRNLRKAEQIRSLYEETKERFGAILSSRRTIDALDPVFTRPMVRNNPFTGRSGMSGPPAQVHPEPAGCRVAAHGRSVGRAASRAPCL